MLSPKISSPLLEKVPKTIYSLQLKRDIIYEKISQALKMKFIFKQNNHKKNNKEITKQEQFKFTCVLSKCSWEQFPRIAGQKLRRHTLEISKESL